MVSKQCTPSNSGANLGLLAGRRPSDFLVCDESFTSLLFLTSWNFSDIHWLCTPLLEEEAQEKTTFCPTDSAQSASKELKIDINIALVWFQDWRNFNLWAAFFCVSLIFGELILILDYEENGIYRGKNLEVEALTVKEVSTLLIRPIGIIPKFGRMIKIRMKTVQIPIFQNFFLNFLEVT